MEDPGVSKYTISFGLSLAMCSVLNALLVVAKESSGAVTAVLQKMTGHHWVTHSGAIIVLFVLGGGLLAEVNHGQGIRMSLNRLLGIIVAGVAAGALIIIGFYLFAD
jgi:hypothetical protein